MIRFAAISIVGLVGLAVVSFKVELQARRIGPGPAPRKHFTLAYEAQGTIETSTDLVHWNVIPIVWTNTALVSNDAPARFYRAPVIPSLFRPTNPILIPQ